MSEESGPAYIEEIHYEFGYPRATKTSGASQSISDQRKKELKQLFLAEGAQLVYPGDNLDQTPIDTVLALAPSQYICLDKAFHGNDQLKANAVKTFAAFNDGKVGIDRIDFKTV